VEEYVPFPLVHTTEVRYEESEPPADPQVGVVPIWFTNWPAGQEEGNPPI